MNLLTVLYLLLAHWVGDFLFQTTRMGTEKFRNNRVLLKHTSIYAATMFVAVTFLLNLSVGEIFAFTFITFVAHTIQDYITSKMTHARFQRLEYNGYNGAFTIIGLDQWLHYVQIFTTYYLLTQNQ